MLGNTFLVQGGAISVTILRKLQILKKPKKQHQAVVTATMMFFEEGLDSSSCRSILFDSFKNLESKVNEIFENINTLKENQIKGEKQLTDLTETVNFLSEKLHKFEPNRKLKEEIIKSLRGQVSLLHYDLKKNGNTSGPTGAIFSLGLSFYHRIKEEKMKTSIALSLIRLRTR